MNTTPTRNEDLTTDKLAELIRSDKSILALFLRFLFPDDLEARKGAALHWDIETQHRFRNGRIDLLLHTPAVAIIIECKVDDGQKIYQLAKYHEYWTTNHSSHPHIFWLTRRKSGPMGRNDFLTRELLWNDLHDHFISLRDQLSRSAQIRVEAFCEYLRAAAILLNRNERNQRVSRNRGYDFDFAEGLLDRIAAKLDLKDFETEVVSPVNEVPHRLFVGQPSWGAKFADGWIKRVVLRFKPATGVANGFTLSGAILLYHNDYSSDPTFAISQFPRWAQVCHDAGMIVGRNAGTKWRGGAKPVLTPPFVLMRPVKYAGADRLVPEDQLQVFMPNQADKAVREGLRVVSKMVEIVDRF